MESKNLVLAPVCLNGKWGYINKNNDMILRPQWEDASPFSEGLAAVKVDGKWGYIDPSGRMVIEPRWRTAGTFAKGFAIGTFYGRHFGEIQDRTFYVFINKKGNQFMSDYDLAEPFNDDGIALVQGRFFGIERCIDTNGKFVLKKYIQPEQTNRGLKKYYDEQTKKWGYKSEGGAVAVGACYDGALDFSEGLGTVRKGNMCGFIRANGLVQIPFIYEGAGHFTKVYRTNRLD